MVVRNYYLLTIFTLFVKTIILFYSFRFSILYLVFSKILYFEAAKPVYNDGSTVCVESFWKYASLDKECRKVYGYNKQTCIGAKSKWIHHK